MPASVEAVFVSLTTVMSTGDDKSTRGHWIAGLLEADVDHRDVCYDGGPTARTREWERSALALPGSSPGRVIALTNRFPD